MNTLEADSIHLSFGQRTILSNVHISCSTGEIVSIIGRNGSGKSSLMKIIFGTTKGQNQSVRINKQYSGELYQQQGAISYLPQEGLFMDYLTPARVAKIFNSPEILEIEAIQRYQKHPIGALSGGVRKLVEIMTMLYSNTKFTMLDEPFSFLSPVLSTLVTDHIQRQSQHKGIILTDHQVDTVWAVAERHYMLYSGNLREVYERSELEQYGYIKSR